MAYKKIGAWDRHPITREQMFFCCYCATCKQKNYLTTKEAQEFFENYYIFLRKISVMEIITKKLTYKLPKIRIIIERGGHENTSLSEVGQGISAIKNRHLLTSDYKRI